jgi:dipeptidyl aminopeptidase/acylaminoacyl peptidase
VEAQALAQLGFIVFIMDARGTPGRGKAFQDVGHGSLGDHEIPDHVAALRALARKRPYMDLGRVGVLGHSFGGYMVLRAMLTAPDVYHVGFASDADGAEVEGIPFHGRHLYIRFLGWLEENPDAYARASSLPLASNLRGTLLLTYNEGHAPTATKLVNAFTKAGKQVAVLPGLPGQPHALGGVYQARWREAIREYFQEHLKP